MKVIGFQSSHLIDYRHGVIAATPISFAIHKYKGRIDARFSALKSTRRALSGTKLSSMVTSFISANDPYSLWTAVALSSAVGLQMEKRTNVGKQLSGPVCAMLVSAILTNMNILPSGGSVYITGLQSFVVKLATPMLLLDADLRKVYKESGKLLAIFVLGAFGTLVGSFIGYLCIQPFLQQGKFDGVWKLAGALTAKNIGGGLNFVAVVDALQISPQLTSIGLAVDNILGLVYFPFISFLGTRLNHQINNTTTTPSPEVHQDSLIENVVSKDVTGWCSALALCLSIVAVSDNVCNLGVVPVPAVVLSTVITVLLATIFPRKLAQENIIAPGETLGKLLLLLFFGSIGTSVGNLSEVLRSPLVLPLLGFGLVLYTIHFLLISKLSQLFFNKGKTLFDERDILIASNANIGNAATASAFATTMGWTSKVVPAILVGTVGNIIGTVVGYYLAVLVLQRIG